MQLTRTQIRHIKAQAKRVIAEARGSHRNDCEYRDHNTLSAIADLLGVNGSIIARILEGTYEPINKATIHLYSGELATGPYEICMVCHHRVKLPCVLCTGRHGHLVYRGKPYAPSVHQIRNALQARGVGFRQ